MPCARTSRSRILCQLAAFAGILLGAHASAQESSETVSSGRATLTEADASAFLDGFVPTALARGDIAGAVVVVVKDGAVLLQRGYGYVDVEARRPVDPETSLFRIGSVAKLFTWTAVMQLAERDQLDLDRDVNAYLDFKIAPRFERPITLRHLLTHTAGFQETLFDFFLDDAAKLVPLGQYLRDNVPSRIFAPGEVVAYSNYGAALGGYIVERASGQPFNSYVDEHILAPLGMLRTTFEQPVPAPLQAALSNGYDRASDNEVRAFEIGQAWPAGSMSTSGADIARFMIAYLNEGALGERRILQPQTVRLMHSRAYSTVPSSDLNGMALGFYQEDRNGRRIVGHAGDTQWFHSNLDLIVDEGVGLFISMNSGGRDGASDAIRFSLFHAFMDRYFPSSAATPAPQGASPAPQDGREIAGSYLWSRRADTNFFSLLNLFAQATAEVDEEGVLEIDQVRGFSGTPMRWRQTAPDRWQQIDGPAKLAVARDAGGAVTAVVSGDGPPVAVLQPAPWYVNKTWAFPLFVATAATLALAVLLWPVTALIRRHYGRGVSPGERRAGALVRLTSLVNLLFLGAWTWLLLTFGQHVTWFNDDLDPWLRLLQLFGLLGVAGTIYVVLRAVRSWRSESRGAWTALGLSAIACACVATVWFSLVFHLLSFSLR